MSDNKNLLFTSAVCVHRELYNELANNLLSDKSKYSVKKRTKTFLETWQKKSSVIYKRWNKNGYLDKPVANDNELTLTDTVYPKFYGLMKLRKNVIALTPKVSTINSTVSKMSGILCSVLQQSCPLPKYNVLNRIELKNELKNLFIPDDYVMLSLDVTSSFTNITGKLVIN